MKDIYERISELSRTEASFALFLTLILYFLSLALLLPGTMGITAWLWGGDINGIQRLLSGDLEAFPGGAYLFRLLQAENQLLTWGFVAIAMAYILGKPKEVLKIKHSPDLFDLLLPGLVLILGLPLVQATYISADSFQLPEFMKGFEESMRLREAQSQEILMTFFSDTRIGILLLNILIFALIPAFCEEFLFRGILQQQFSRRMSPHFAILLSAGIFSFIHFQFYGFFGRMLLGVILGYFLYASGSLWPSIIAHFVFNAFSILIAYLAAAKGLIDPEITQDSYQFSFSLVLFSLLSVGILMFLYLRRQRTPSILPHE